MATLGSLALDPRTRELFLGEENGTRIYRLTLDERLALHATGLQRLAGGGTLAFDEAGRLLVADYTDPTVAPGEDRGPPGLEALREDDYRGPLVFRLAHDSTIPEPRRLERVPPLFPRGWRAKGPSLFPRMISVAPVGSDIALLATTGELFRLTSDGALVLGGAAAAGSRYVQPNARGRRPRWHSARERRLPRGQDLPGPRRRRRVHARLEPGRP